MLVDPQRSGIEAPRCWAATAAGPFLADPLSLYRPNLLALRYRLRAPRAPREKEKLAAH